jgi:hypothetical protein
MLAIMERGASVKDFSDRFALERTLAIAFVLVLRPLIVSAFFFWQRE